MDLVGFVAKVRCTICFVDLKIPLGLLDSMHLYSKVLVLHELQAARYFKSEMSQFKTRYDIVYGFLVEII